MDLAGIEPATPGSAVRLKSVARHVIDALRGPDYVLVFVLVSLLCVLSSFAIILTRNRELVALLLLPFRCLVTINILWLFLMVPWFGLLCVIVIFPYHTDLLFTDI